jgi:quercetin dioxygenase-like cupin family protein
MQRLLFTTSTTLALALSAALAEEPAGTERHYTDPYAMPVVSTALAGSPAMSAVGVEPPIPLLKATVTETGDPLKYPATGKPEITSFIATIQPGGHTALYRHPVVTFVYVLDGEFEVHHGAAVRSYKAGEALIEPIGMPMQGFNRGAGPLRLLVVNVGEEGQPNAVAVE